MYYLSDSQYHGDSSHFFSGWKLILKGREMYELAFFSLFIQKIYIKYKVHEVAKSQTQLGNFHFQ